MECKKNGNEYIDRGSVGQSRYCERSDTAYTAKAKPDEASS